MGEPFSNQAEYLDELLFLMRERLDILTKPPDTEVHAFLVQQIQEDTEDMHRRCVDSLESGMAIPLEYLFYVFSLSDFERYCVSMALAAELDHSYANKLSSLQRGGLSQPTLELCLRTFTQDELSRLELLAQWHTRASWMDYLFEEGHRGSACEDGLKLHSRIVDFVMDPDLPDPYLDGLIWESWSGQPLPELVLRSRQLDEMKRFAEQADPERPKLCVMNGAVGSGRRTLVRHLCEHLDVMLIEVDLEPLLLRPETWPEILIHIFREARLRSAALALVGVEKLLQDEEAPTDEDGQKTGSPSWDGREHVRYLLRKAAETVDYLFLITQHPWRPEIDCGRWQLAELTLETPDAASRLQLWTVLTNPMALDGAVSLDSLANKFALEPGQIAAAARDASRLQRWQGSELISSEHLHQACRSQLPHDLGKMASRVNAGYTWEDLILPPEQKNRLQQACDQVEYRRKVYEEWGFGKKVAYGRGVSMLFSGPPGTGKTMAAQVIANRLQLELYKVDLSGVMSKYVGETEKQLGAVFDGVKRSQSILFFDEADALFGKRSETRDSHDRFANVQTSYLLQKIEDYDGIVILASNFLQNFDEAFKRRIKFIIDFTLPDQERREQIWRSVIPAELPRSDDVDFDFLARSFELSGSSIKNITVAAAFLAAAEGCPMNMTHLLVATQAEQFKAGKSMGRDSFGEYYHQVELYQGSKTNRREYDE